ncbi:MAG TPA: hypothetical protein VF648_08665 [Pyrinomonadaceae bacterium]|jgi:hypothetical protein
MAEKIAYELLRAGSAWELSELVNKRLENGSKLYGFPIVVTTKYKDVDGDDQIAESYCQAVISADTLFASTNS